MRSAPESRADLDELGLARQGAARQDENRASVEPVDLLRQRFGKGFAEHDAFHLRKAIGAAQHRYTPILREPPGYNPHPPSPLGLGP